MTRSWFSPGKVVLVGEYAVVDGAPAVVAAVPIGVGLRVDDASPRTVDTPGGDTRFVDAALDAAGVREGRWVFSDEGGPPLASKPGLGGSAAATVAAVYAALTTADGTPPSRQAVYELAADVHRAVQGSGSGVDVAASTWGGVLRFVRDEGSSPLAELAFNVVWSGGSARTGPRLARYQSWAGRPSFVATSRALVDAFASDPLRVVDENRRVLEAMADAAGLEYRTPAIDHLVALAASFGGAAKASGAGGGDCVVAFFADADAERAFRAACARDDFPILATHAAPGVAARPSEDP